MVSPAPVVVVKQLNDYNVMVELRAWYDDERKHIEARTALREAAFVALTKAGVDLPFETFRIEPLTVKQAAA
jgi:small conductance mechanosensitive channel